MSSTMKRFRSLAIMLALAITANYAISLASGVTTIPDFPKPKSGVTTIPDFPKPKSGVTTIPDFPKP